MEKYLQRVLETCTYVTVRVGQNDYSYFVTNVYLCGWCLLNNAVLRSEALFVIGDPFHKVMGVCFSVYQMSQFPQTKPEYGAFK